MPTIEFSYKDFQSLLGRKLPIDEFKDLTLLYAKAEVEDYQAGMVKVALDDTNLPYLWCVEGLARFFRGVLGIERGLPKIKFADSNFKVVVDSSVKKLRPYIATFVADGKVIDNYLLEQLIQFQEKFCEGYGRKRAKVSIGLYSNKRIKFPIHYKAVQKDSVEFVPLEMKSRLKLSQILKQHSKGKQYGWIIQNMPNYPILVDDTDAVLSLVPIINSNHTGKLVIGNKELMFEATGTDEDSVNLAANIFAQNLYDRGFKIHGMTVEYGNKKVKSPVSFKEKVKFDREQVKSLVGLDLNQAATKKLLEKARYDVSGYTVTVPDYRRDILHVFDVIEDIAIMYGFDKIESSPLTSYTVGSSTEMNMFVDKARELAVGLGFQEILSPVLSNKTVLEEKMEALNTGLVEIENVMSETYSAVRNWLTPILMEVLSKNKHRDFPQKIFEQGIVNIRAGNKILSKESLALAISNTTADYTEIKQAADGILKSFGLTYSVKPSENSTFMTGRGGTLEVKGKVVGIIGEISPKVLINWQLEMPTTVLEIDLSEIKRLT